VYDFTDLIADFKIREICDSKIREIRDQICDQTRDFRDLL
jgi:hypothetical protein